MSNLAQRTLTAIVFVIVLLGSISFSGISCLALFIVIILLCQHEFYNFFKDTEIRPQRLLGILGGISLVVFSFLSLQDESSSSLLFLIIPLFFLVFIAELYRNKPTPIPNIAYTLLGIVYIALPFTLLYKTAHFQGVEFTNTYSYQVPIGFLFVLWANDTGAYFAGRSLGKHKLFERISPKKTWEGSIGGGIAGLLVGYLNSLLFDDLSLSLWLGLAAIVVIFGSLGDLVESLFKRSLSIKDSGTILPGHGGVLDRFDGIFIAAPMVYTYLKIISIL